jgi:2-polyprenyl-6-methoxyphenol hydroxylase-like FAD-dependent oxidoreductase
MATANHAEPVTGAKAGPSSSCVLVVGGGPVGCLTAFKLGRAGIDVSVIERLPATSDSPRACGYFGAVHHMLDELGLYKLFRAEGFMTKGICWRKKPKDDGKGRKLPGEIIAVNPLTAPDDTTFEVGFGLLNLPQADLNKLLLREALKTGHVRVHFNTELVGISQNDLEKGVTVKVRSSESNEEKELHATYLIGADGAHSATRKALGLPFPGHTWPERMVATNVMVHNDDDPLWHTFFVMDPVHCTISTPLEDPICGKKTLWRYTIAAAPDDARPDEELVTDENIFGLYEGCMAGGRPLDVEIKARSVYKVHQRLVPTMRRGNCLLAGDAAHVNHVSTNESLTLGKADMEHAALWSSRSEHGLAGCRRCRRNPDHGPQRA